MAASIHDLAKVEIQLINQFLDFDSLIRFASCSKSLRSDAYSKESLRYQPLLNIDHNFLGAKLPPILLRCHPYISFDSCRCNSKYYRYDLMLLVKRLNLAEITNPYRYQELPSTKLYFMSIINGIIKESSFLTTFNIVHNNLGNIINTTIEAIGKSKSLTSIDLSMNDLYSDNAAILAEALKVIR